MISLRIPDPRVFLGQRIVKRNPDGELRKGEVERILNMEGLNTMFIVQFDDKPDEQELFRIIYDYVNGDLWIDEPEPEANGTTYVN